MSHFKNGGLLFGFVYTLWRGSRSLFSVASTWFYRKTIGKVGSATKFHSGIFVSHPQAIVIGDECFIGRNVILQSESDQGRLILKNGVQITEGSQLDFTGGLSIGERVLMSEGVKIYTHDHGYDPHSVPSVSPLVIEDDVWIGEGAVILPKVGKIGKGAIVGASAVVTKAVPAGAIVAGNPARVVKYKPEAQGRDS